MECTHVEDQLIDYIENNLAKTDTNQIKAHVNSCQSCANALKKMQDFLAGFSNVTTEYPSQNLRINFEKVLAEEKHLEQTKVVKLEPKFNYKTFLKYAAGIALLVSTFLVGRYQQSEPSNQEIADLKSETISAKQTAMLALMENESASKRIQGVQYIEEFTDPDPEIVEALVKRMLLDENTNVRLTAVNALEAFISAEAVKEGFIKALETEKDPTIQISIIKSLVKIQEKKAFKPMQKLLEQDETQSFVKDEIKTVLTNTI